MWDRQEILQFVQRNHEPYYHVWERYKDLLRDFPYHGFNREGQLMNFLDGLTTATREWVEGGTITSFYNFTADEAYQYLEDLAGYDYQCWNPPQAYQCFEEEKYNPATYQDPINLTMECFLKLHTNSTPYLEATQLHEEEQRRKQIDQLQTQLDNLQIVVSTTLRLQGDSIAAMSRREELKRVQLQLDQIQKELSILSSTPTNSIETVAKEVECEIDQMPSEPWEYYDVVTFDEDSMVEMPEALIISDEVDDESSLSETPDITLSSSIEDSKSKYHLWTTPQPPSFRDSFKTSHPYKSKRSPFVRMFRKPQFAKLEGVEDQNPWDVLYDTYYGRKPLFEDLWRRREAGR